MLDELTKARVKAFYAMPPERRKLAHAALVALNTAHPEATGVRDTLELVERLLAEDERNSSVMRNLANEPGYAGMFTRAEAPGAIPNGTAIQKIASEVGDSTPTGARGVVLGSIHTVANGYAYWVEWEDKPRVAVFVTEIKIARVGEQVGTA